MSETSKHSPVPWKQGDEINGEVYNCNLIYEELEGVCMMYGIPTNTTLEDVNKEKYAKGLANAAFIVKSVNLHQELVAVLELVEWAGPLTICPCCRRPSVVGHIPSCHLNNALTKAKAQQ